MRIEGGPPHWGGFPFVVTSFLVGPKKEAKKGLEKLSQHSNCVIRQPRRFSYFRTMQTMKLPEVRRAMRQTRVERGEEKPVPFSLEFVTCDETRGTGGEFRQVRNACMASISPELPKAAAGPREDKPSSPFIRIMDMDANRVVMVHLRLITKFNQYEVTW